MKRAIYYQVYRFVWFTLGRLKAIATAVATTGTGLAVLYADNPKYIWGMAIAATIATYATPNLKPSPAEDPEPSPPSFVNDRGTVVFSNRFDQPSPPVTETAPETTDVAPDDTNVSDTATIVPDLPVVQLHTVITDKRLNRQRDAHGRYLPKQPLPSIFDDY